MVKKFFAAALMMGFLMSMTPMVAQAKPHPKIRQAIKALEVAKVELNHAAHDFGGHRVEAIAAIDRALEQLNLCMQHDK